MLFDVVIAGAELSRMVWVIVTVKLVDPSFPASSYAVHVIVVTPIENIVPVSYTHLTLPTKRIV